jgi:hypothetical protein
MLPRRARAVSRVPSVCRCAWGWGRGFSFWGVGTSWQKVPWFLAFGGEKPGIPGSI